MFGRKKQAMNIAIDITRKRVKTWWGGSKIVPTTKAEQRKMREMIEKIDPNVTVIDHKAKNEQQLQWIDRIEEIDALFNP